MLPPADKARVAVFGAGGYSGALLCRILARHPGTQLVLLGSERLAQEGRAAYADWGLPQDALILPEPGAAAACDKLHIEVALLATPAEISLSLAAQLLGPPPTADQRSRLRVLDLSGAFRLADPALFQRTYGLPHTAPELLREAVYVLPEVIGAAELRAARLVANPGCYVTAAVLALAPLLRGGALLAGAPIFIDGKSGATGAGRKASVALSLSELFGDLRPYRIGQHQHTPEIAAVLQRLAPADCGPAGSAQRSGAPSTGSAQRSGAPSTGSAQRSAAPSIEIRFVPHLCGVPRGLLVTCHAQLRPGVDQAAVDESLMHNYADCPRIHVVPAEQVSLRRPVGTPDAWVGAQVTGGTVCAAASLDNLLKGAASQAVQNLNGMLGLPEATGLESLWSV